MSALGDHDFEVLDLDALVDAEALRDLEALENLEALSDDEAPAPPRALKARITLLLRSKVRSLRTLALWPFRRIAASVQLPVSMVFSICAQPDNLYLFYPLIVV